MLLERIVSKAVPLDVQAEVHTRADRITLEMRRVLLDLVRAAAGERRDAGAHPGPGRSTVPRWLAPLAGVAVVARAVDHRRAGRLGERHGRHAGRGRSARSSARPATCTGGRRGPPCGRRRAAWSSAGSLAFVAALVTATVPPLRRAINRGWPPSPTPRRGSPWRPCLLVVLGSRSRADGCRRPRRVLLRVRRRHRRAVGGAAQRPRRRSPPSVRPRSVRVRIGAAARLLAVARSTGSSWPRRRRSPAPSSASGTAPSGASGVLLLSGMQSGRAERLWAASLLSAACGLLAFALLRAGPPRLGRTNTDPRWCGPTSRWSRDRHLVRSGLIELADGGGARRRAGDRLVGVDRARRRLAARRAAAVAGLGGPRRHARRLPRRGRRHVADRGHRPRASASSPARSPPCSPPAPGSWPAPSCRSSS